MNPGKKNIWGKKASEKDALIKRHKKKVYRTKKKTLMWKGIICVEIIFILTLSALAVTNMFLIFKML